MAKVFAMSSLDEGHVLLQAAAVDCHWWVVLE